MVPVHHCAANLQNGLVLGNRTRSVSPYIDILKHLESYNKLQVPKIGLPKGARYSSVNRKASSFGNLLQNIYSKSTAATTCDNEVKVCRVPKFLHGACVA